MRQSRRAFLAMVPVAGLTAVLAGCNGGGGANPTSTSASATSGGGTPDTIRIVSSLPRTGSAKGQTDTIVNGIKMAFEEVDYKVGNFKIIFEDLDDATAAEGKWTPERESANADQAVKDPDVMVYLGPYN
ncbi:MAG: branched-chain amino acid ABC transporter substrate-binding protein, partial [Gemmataceae bacterium]